MQKRTHAAAAETKKRRFCSEKKRKRRCAGGETAEKAVFGKNDGKERSRKADGFLLRNKNGESFLRGQKNSGKVPSAVDKKLQKTLANRLQFMRVCIIIVIYKSKFLKEDVMIKTIAKPAERKVTGCGECRSTCQSACKTSCTVGNQSCERITREEKIERK